jgi:hypothetical protein
MWGSIPGRGTDLFLNLGGKAARVSEVFGCWRPICVEHASHHTSGALNFQVTVTWASVYGRRIGVRLHFEATLTLSYTATFNQTRTAPLFVCHGEETEFCVVFVEGTATLKLSVYLGYVGFFSVPLTSVSRLSGFATRKYFELKLHSGKNPYFMSFFHKS